MSEKMSPEGRALALGFVYADVTRNVAAAIRDALAARDAEWREAVLASGYFEYDHPADCAPLRDLMGTPTRETPTPESK